MSNKFSIGCIDDKLYIRTRELGRSKTIPLHIEVAKSLFDSHFNKEFKQFKTSKSHPQLETFNKKIKNALDEFEKVDFSASAVSTGDKSFIEYIKQLTDLITNHGTKIKNQVVITKLEHFLRFTGKDKLLFKEITPSFLGTLKHYLLTEHPNTPDPKKLSSNTAKHYLKMFKTFVKKAAIEDVHTFTKDPFISVLNFTSKDIQRNILSIDDIQKLVLTEITDETINTARNMFLFALYANGMRVSDLMLLRWNNIKITLKDNVYSSRLDYTMYKTGNGLDFPMSVSMSEILSDLVADKNRLNRLEKTIRMPYVDLFGTRNRGENFINVTLNKIDSVIKEHTIIKPERYADDEKLFMSKLLTGEIMEYKGYFISNDKFEKVVKLIIHRERIGSEIDYEFVELTNRRIKRVILNENRGNEFIFPYLDNKTFEGLIDLRQMKLHQYKALKHATIVYNRHLKLVMKVCDIETNISSHVSRHSFTNILVSNGVSPNDIKTGLAHQNLRTTDIYINKAFNKNGADYVTKKASDIIRKR